MVHIPLSPPFTSSLPLTLPLPSPSLQPPPPPPPPSPLTESRSVYDTLENALRQEKDLKQVQQQEQAPPPLSQPAALSQDKPQNRTLPSHSAVGPMGSGTAVRGVAGHGFLWKPSIVDTVVNCLSSLPSTFLPSLLPFLSALPPFPPPSLPPSLPPSPGVHSQAAETHQTAAKAAGRAAEEDGEGGREEEEVGGEEEKKRRRAEKKGGAEKGQETQGFKGENPTCTLSSTHICSSSHPLPHSLLPPSLPLVSSLPSPPSLPHSLTPLCIISSGARATEILRVSTGEGC